MSRPSFASTVDGLGMSSGKEAREASRRVVDVRSLVRRRALAVARREGRGGGGLREVVREFRREGEGVGREAARMAALSWDWGSIVGG